ncbi:MAG TPA: hypothetical protein VFL36_22830 [Myxococcales bacterium]|nr:hypothetical protein [Myxococcales bacterium]
MPIDVLERIAPGLPFTKTAGDVQKKTIGNMYEMIHVVNKTAGDIAEDLLAMARKAKGSDRPSALRFQLRRSALLSAWRHRPRMHGEL